MRWLLALLLCSQASAFDTYAKWNKTTLTYAFNARPSLVRAAFDSWQDTGVVAFKRVYRKPDITVRFGYKNLPEDLVGYCLPSYDSDGYIIHAEIRVAKWTNHRVVLLHEIGHALGLAHSGEKDAVMYYEPTAAELSEDDVEGLRSLYSR